MYSEIWVSKENITPMDSLLEVAESTEVAEFGKNVPEYLRRFGALQ